MKETKLARLKRELAEERAVREFYQELATRRLLDQIGKWDKKMNLMQKTLIGLLEAADCEEFLIVGTTSTKDSGDGLLLLGTDEMSRQSRLNLLLSAALMLTQEEEDADEMLN